MKLNKMKIESTLLTPNCPNEMVSSEKLPHMDTSYCDTNALSMMTETSSRDVSEALHCFLLSLFQRTVSPCMKWHGGCKAGGYMQFWAFSHFVFKEANQ